MNAQIRQEAAQWLVEFRADESDGPTRERFTEWLRTSPEHVRAYLELMAIWEDASLYDSQRQLNIDELLNITGADVNVVAFGPPPNAGPAASSAQPQSASLILSPPSIAPRAVMQARHVRRRFVAAAALVACVAIALGARFALPLGLSYSTDIGEQRSVRLADGSNVELNALSRIRIHLSDHERTIELLRGQALFRVARDAARPFMVISGDTRVRAIGTQFDVNRTVAATVVTVVEGRVAIVPEKDPTADPLSRHEPSSVEIDAGEELTVRSSATPQKGPANIAAATAWTQQELIFESTPLAEVAEEFNRFNARRLIIQGKELADFHISGTFPALDPASLSRFVVFLRTQPGIQIHESGDRIVVTQK